jgi:hypothetical protein
VKHLDSLGPTNESAQGISLKECISNAEHGFNTNLKNSFISSESDAMTY